MSQTQRFDKFSNGCGSSSALVPPGYSEFIRRKYGIPVPFSDEEGEDNDFDDPSEGWGGLTEPSTEYFSD